MAFRALLFSRSPETNAAMTTACRTAAIFTEVSSDIFTAIEKAKTRPFSCVIADWADQPEASFLLKRARESTPNRETVAIVIVDNEPTAAEMRDNRLDLLIYRPISSEEADAVLAKACEQMQPTIAPDPSELSAESDANAGGSTADSAGDAQEPHQSEQASDAGEENAGADGETTFDESEGQPRQNQAIGIRGAVAAVLVIAAVFCLWRSREVIQYLSHTREGRSHVLRESVAALFNMNQSGAVSVATAGSDAQQDAYFSRVPSSSNAQTPELQVVATESSLPEARTALPKAADFPLPAPEFEHQDPPPVHVQRVAIPESMKSSPPIAPPVVVTVNPSQMMPISAPMSATQTQPVNQQVSEPIAVSEEAARALLVHTVDPVYPAEGSAQNLHGTVVLQALVGRDGSVQDLKIVRGNFILSRAAIAAVKQWQFQPYSINGHAAATQTVITVNFSSPTG